ncbi:hypothetical protein RFI_35961 [Reticulomyxa filosa]|uniref:Uncharacterized protein n=1 Tax=Reticulomyxa filosa TaxID=46433 RepID=X6LIQ2_RETFI|nr:hypothetical protein RFI_35961 [Reticulomyxa filosa]|eukprot:ETO01479.1 hypothetical protein RFI_35961 [Reticulomyxa filosa]
MSKEEDKCIEAAEDKETEEEYQNALVDKHYEKRLAAIWKQQRETRKIWYSRQLIEKQLKQLESLKAQQQRSKTDAKQQQKPSHMEHAIVVDDQDVCATCSVVSTRSADAKSQDCKKGLAMSKKKTVSKSVRVAMRFDSSIIVQPFYQGPFYWEKQFVFLKKRHKYIKHTTSHAWLDSNERGRRVQTIHYPSKFLRKKYRSVNLLNSKGLADTYNDQPAPNVYNKEKHKKYYQLNNNKDVFCH